MNVGVSSASGDVGVTLNVTWSISCALYLCPGLCPVSGHWNGEGESCNFSCGLDGDDGKEQESDDAGFETSGVSDDGSLVMEICSTQRIEHI